MTEPTALAPPASTAPLIERLLWRFRRWWAPLNFAAGMGSFFLINRQEVVGLWVAGFLLAGWLLILAEGTLGRWLARRQFRWAQASPWLLRFVTQGIHQETFFFALPFLLHTTTWTSMQAVFTGVVGAAALASTWDPVYHRRVAGSAAGFLAFHALSVYVATLILLPTFLHLTSAETLIWSSVAVAVLAVPSLAQLAQQRHARQWLASFAGAAGLGVLAWLAGPWVPPATLWIGHAVISQQVDEAQREPGPPLREIDVATLQAGGLYAYSAIRAPRGLEEQVYHRWLQDGRLIDRIALHIEGGREQGYRAWTHKQDFPAEPEGNWRVEVVTDGGQLIGLMRFRVRGAGAAPPAESQPEPVEVPAAPVVDEPAPDLPVTPPDGVPTSRTPG